MITTTVVHRCPHRAGERLQRNGRTGRGAQRALCRGCQRTFTLAPKGPRSGEPFKAQVCAAVQDRMSLRGVSRTFGVCYQTIQKWLGKKMVGRPDAADTLLPGQNGDVLELDELWSFAGRKADPLWLWVAPCRRTRQVVAWTLGDRGEHTAAELRVSLPKGYRGRATCSDHWEASRAVFPARTHRGCGKQEGQTCHVERWFGTLRGRVGRVVRKAYSFSKHPESHLDALHLFITAYNLQIKQSTPS